MDYYYNFTTVIEQVAGNIDGLCRELFPAGKKKGSNWCVGDESGEAGQSFQISLKPQNAGCYIDRSDTSIRGNPIALVALCRNISYQDAGEWLAKFCGVSPDEKVFERKKRKKPVIKRDELSKLSPSSITFAKTRGITEDTLRQLKIVSNDRAMAMPHFDCDGEIGLLKFWPTDGSKKIWTNEDPIHTLFGKQLVDPIKSGGCLIICEGQWDAMTWIQMGYPAVSIPSGAHNDGWIEEDWPFLNLFTTIFLDFDNDKEGLNAESRVKTRLGYEKVRVLRYPQKDANEVLKDGHDLSILTEAYLAARDAPVEHIVRAEDIRHIVKNHLSDTRETGGIPFFVRSMNKLEFRPHEATLWFGLTGHGKSTAIMNQFAFQAGMGIPGLIASFEDNASVNYASMLKQFSYDNFIGGSDNYDASFDQLTKMVYLFDSMQRTKPEELVSTFILAHKQLGICNFAIDNVMTMEVDRQDNTAQAAVADALRVFVSRFPVHLHVAAHPRKAQDGHIIRPPQIGDVRGASEWGDMSQNAICVFRDVKKSERLAEMYDGGRPVEEIETFRRSCPDGKFLTRKQRTTGDLPICSFNFESDVKRFWKTEDDKGPYWQLSNNEPPEETNEPF